MTTPVAIADREQDYRELDERVRDVREQRALLDAQVADLLDRRREAAREAILVQRFEARMAKVEKRLESLEQGLRVYP